LIAVVANVSTHRVWLLFGPISVARALGVKDFTKARVKAETKFDLLPKGGKGQLPYVVAGSVKLVTKDSLLCT
jgi:hypothetical protein